MIQGQADSFKPARLKGLSARLIASHYENNYGGAVRRLNGSAASCGKLDPATAPGFVLNGLKREELIATNSMLLHEVYFDGLGGSGGDAGRRARRGDRPRLRLDRSAGAPSSWPWAGRWAAARAGWC